MNTTPYSLAKPPSAPKKSNRKATFVIPLEWRDRARRNLAQEFRDEERRQQVREAEERVKERRRRRQREAEEKEERFLWLREDYAVPDLDGPHPQP